MTEQIDSIAVSIVDQDVVCIHNVRYKYDIDMGGKLYIDRTSVPWLIDALANYLDSETIAEQKLGNDELQVTYSGSDYEPNVCLINDRPDNAPRGRSYIQSFTVEVAKDLLGQLRALGV